jgi:hypothetical protein
MLELDDFQHILITRVPALTGMSSIRFARLLRDEQNPRGTPSCGYGATRRVRLLAALHMAPSGA